MKMEEQTERLEKGSEEPAGAPMTEDEKWERVDELMAEIDRIAETLDDTGAVAACAARELPAADGGRVRATSLMHGTVALATYAMRHMAGRSPEMTGVMEAACRLALETAGLAGDVPGKEEKWQKD